MNCPKCGGQVYDNRADKASGKRGAKVPDFKCKDKDGCGWVEWGQKPGPTAPTSSGNGHAGPVNGRYTWGAISKLYERSLFVAEKHLKGLAERSKVTVTTADILAAAATVFTVASRDGIRSETPKAAAPPPPPPPPPEPEIPPMDEDDGLPF